MILEMIFNWAVKLYSKRCEIKHLHFDSPMIEFYKLYDTMTMKVTNNILTIERHWNYGYYGFKYQNIDIICDDPQLFEKLKNIVDNYVDCG